MYFLGDPTVNEAVPSSLQKAAQVSCRSPQAQGRKGNADLHNAWPSSDKMLCDLG